MKLYPMKLELIQTKAKAKSNSPAILFVHGMWHGAWCFEKYFMPYFSEQGYDTFAISLRGHGGSEGREGLRWHSIADYVQDVEWAVGQINKPTIIVGHSMGGYVSQKYLEKNSLLAGVLLTSVPHTSIWGATFRVLAKYPMAVIKSILTLNLYHVVKTRELARFALFSKSMPEENVTEYQSKLIGESFRAYLDMLGLGILFPKKVKSPILVIGGADDVVISEGNIFSSASAYHTEPVIVPNIAHDVMLEENWMLVADWMLNWFKENDF
jgi:pimeloyl-ACP methyl ester carboxylesterase